MSEDRGDPTGSAAAAQDPAASRVDTFDAAMAASVNAALVGELDEGLAIDPSIPFGEERRLFAALYIRHRHGLSQHARRYLNDSRDVDEVVQETFLRLFLALPDLESEAQAVAWCRRTLTNLCIDRYRAAKRRPRLIDLGLVAHELVVADEPSDPLVAAEDAAIVRHALSLLSPLHRDALIKREIEEKSLPQIAAELGVPEESVKHLLYRARRALRRLLVGTGLEPTSLHAKAVGSALLLILTVIFGLPALRSSTEPGVGSASSPRAGGALTGPPSPPSPPSPAGPERAGQPPATQPAATAPAAVAAPEPAPPVAVPPAGPTGTRNVGASVAPPPAAGAGSAQDPAAAATLLAPAATGPAVGLDAAAPAPAPEPAALASPSVGLPAPTEPTPITDAFGRQFAITGGGTLSGTGEVEQLSVQRLDSGQAFASSRFVSRTTTGELALHQNVTEEADGRVVLDVVPILFGADGAQLQVEVLEVISLFARQADGSIQVRSATRLSLRPMAAHPADPLALPAEPAASWESNLDVELRLTGDLSTVVAEFVTLT